MDLTYSLHKITEADQLSFSATEYSKFKFGDKNIARKFGYALAEGFIQDFFSWHPITKQIVVVSSPYCFIPTATFAMKDYFVQRLNQHLASKGLNVVQETKIHRTLTYKEDYGNLSAEKRLELIQNDGFHIDKFFVQGKHTIYLDDIRITGSHEKVIRRMFDTYGIQNEAHTFLYFAELVSREIDPKFENFLNYYFVKSLLDLDKIIKNENFLLNTRVVKYILNAPFEQFEPFINYQTLRFAHTLYNQAVGNSYHRVDEYQRNFEYLKRYLGHGS